MMLSPRRQRTSGFHHITPPRQSRGGIKRQHLIILQHFVEQTLQLRPAPPGGKASMPCAISATVMEAMAICN